MYASIVDFPWVNPRWNCSTVFFVVFVSLLWISVDIILYTMFNNIFLLQFLHIFRSLFLYNGIIWPRPQSVAFFFFHILPSNWYKRSLNSFLLLYLKNSMLSRPCPVISHFHCYLLFHRFLHLLAHLRFSHFGYSLHYFRF